ncbi:MAG: YlxM family DNA-binding protein [Muribaculum sp.]|nr:YlxM family DNA-binding protein [Muribaculum sp.]
MDKIGEKALLYDFYGELLTPHQRSIYEDVVFQDMSLGEIAEEQGISRQGVHDLMKRCDKILQDYEAKLHLLERFADAKAKLSEIVELTRFGQPGQGEDTAALMRQMERIRELAGQLQRDL